MSSGSFTARGRYLTQSFSAFIEKMSLIGLAPWYAGRKMGLVGLGTLSVYGMAVQLSSEWHSTSNPELAFTAAGMVRVLSGSQMPIVGFRLRWAMPVLARLETRSKIAVPVVSEPVPAVVGTATRGFNGLSIGLPLPNGALTKSKKSASGYEVYRFISLAVSMTEPPPTARKASGLNGLAHSMASLMLWCLLVAWFAARRKQKMRRL